MGKKVIVRGVSDLKMPFVQKLYAFIVNQIGDKHTFRIVATSPDYRGFEVLYGLIRYEKGQKFEFHIHGTERFAEIVENLLRSEGWIITTRQVKP